MRGPNHLPISGLVRNVRAQNRLCATPRGVWGVGAGESARARAVKGPCGGRKSTSRKNFRKKSEKRSTLSSVAPHLLSFPLFDFVKRVTNTVSRFQVLGTFSGDAHVRQSFHCELKTSRQLFRRQKDSVCAHDGRLSLGCVLAQPFGFPRF